MRRMILILLCTILMGAGTFLCTLERMEGKSIPVAWWSIFYERPNPDRLPVQVHFLWAKGLE